MQSTLTGPTGAAMIRPTAKPRRGNAKSITMALDSGMGDPGRAAQLRIRTILQNAFFSRHSWQTRLRLYYAHESVPEENGIQEAQGALRSGIAGHSKSRAGTAVPAAGK